MEIIPTTPAPAPPLKRKPKPGQYISLGSTKPNRQVIKFLPAGCPMCGGLSWWCGAAAELPTGHLIQVKTCTGCGFYKILPCVSCAYDTEERAAKGKKAEEYFELDAIGA